jgi:DNA-binding response OmpR family regulator
VTRLLVVDDDTDYLDGIREALERRGYAVETEETADRAIAAAERLRFDAALLDLDLGGAEERDGVVVGRALKNAQPSARVLLISARDGARLAAAAREADADLHLVKPVTAALVAESLAALGVKP